ncbi:hypothetical protein [Rhizobium lusitanum]|uniref:Uncharacterized protein n=1 Tax=Rhizobium lusitanum TaxID=293958 RepID=A0A1C3URY9_9HYPH|nr:hypothetical protein [Rhizobium lusitanum]SCB18204.1 hypothetical protein GA0061101_103232 [Rhizobium lusitanum]
MEAEDFKAFLQKMGLSDTEAMRKLGIGSHNTLAAYKQNGGPNWLGLACAAIVNELPAWEGDRVLVHAFKVWNHETGEYFFGRSLRTEESIQRIKGEIVPGSSRYVDRAEIKEGRFDITEEITDADSHYLGRLLQVAKADEMPADQVRGFASDMIHLHTVEGRGDRNKLARLFSARAPETDTAKRIEEAIRHYL